MKTFARLVALMLGLGLFTGGSAHAQILVNPGFETGDTTGWILMGADQLPERWQIVTGPVHEGSYALLAKNWPKDISTTFSPIDVSTISEFSFWISVTLNSTTMVVLSYSDGTDQSISLANTAGEYFKKDITAQMDLSKELKGFSLSTWSPGDPGAVDTYYDSFTLTVVPEGGSIFLSLLGVGIVVLGLRCKGTRKVQEPIDYLKQQLLRKI